MKGFDPTEVDLPLLREAHRNPRGLLTTANEAPSTRGCESGEWDIHRKEMGGWVSNFCGVVLEAGQAGKEMEKRKGRV